MLEALSNPNLLQQSCVLDGLKQRFETRQKATEQHQLRPGTPKEPDVPEHARDERLEVVVLLTSPRIQLPHLPKLVLAHLPQRHKPFLELLPALDVLGEFLDLRTNAVECLAKGFGNEFGRRFRGRGGSERSDLGGEVGDGSRELVEEAGLVVRVKEGV